MTETARRNLALGFTLAWLSLASLAAFASDWPQWRGPTENGISTEKDLPLSWGGKDNANVLWKIELPKSQNPFSSPIVSRGKVFIASALDNPLEHRVVCLDAKDGSKLWDTPVQPGPWKLGDLRGGYNAPTPAADGERVYAVFGSAVVAALDYDGKLLWRSPLKVVNFDVAMGMSPIVYDDTVLLLCERISNSSLIAFDGKTGDVKWEAKRPNSTFAHTTPLLTKVNGKPMLIVGVSNALQGVDPADGKILWSCPFRGDVPTPVHGDTTVYCDGGRGGTAGIAVDPTGTGDVAKTHLKWKTEPLGEGFGSALIIGDLLYRLMNSGSFRCLKLATGEQVYAQKLPGVCGRCSPVAAADGRIYCASGGKSYVVQAGPEFKILGTGDLGDPNDASPAVADGKLFLRGRKFLFCIGTKP